MTNPDDLMSISEAARRLGISRLTLSRRVHRFGLKTYRTARDTRARLIRLSDVERLFEPVPEKKGSAR